jgi:hypothetical protein
MSKSSSIQGFGQGMIIEIHQHRPKLKDVSTISHVKTKLWGKIACLEDHILPGNTIPSF